MLCNWADTPRLLHQWTKRYPEHRPPAVSRTRGFLRTCSFSTTVRWPQSCGINSLLSLCTHNITKKLKLHCYPRLDTTQYSRPTVWWHWLKQLFAGHTWRYMEHRDLPTCASYQMIQLWIQYRFSVQCLHRSGKMIWGDSLPFVSTKRF